MADKLKSIPVLGAPLTAFGLGTTTDNHGNSVTGNELTCGKNAPVKLNPQEWGELHAEIWRPHGIAAELEMRTDGEIPMLGGMESPLKSECERLNAQSRHSSTQPKRTKS